MQYIKFWQNLDEAWEAAGDADPDSMSSLAESEVAARWRLIKRESRSRLMWLEADGYTPMVLKIYRTPPKLAWRTFALTSRANREFTVMMEAHRQGLPIVRPRFWMERRSAGCMRFGAVALDAVRRPDLESWLVSGEGNAAQRLDMATAAGRILARFHRAGLFWETATARNLMIPAEGESELKAIDLPYAQLYRSDITGTAQAGMDLRCILLLSNGKPAFNDEERLALMTGYCDGSEREARALNSRVVITSHREWKRQRMMRRLSNLFRKGTKSPGRGGIYHSDSGKYESLQTEEVFLPD